MTESSARSNLSVYSKSEIDTLLSLKAPYEIKSSTDFNSMTTPGLYTMRSSSTNSPSGECHSSRSFGYKSRLTHSFAK